MFRRVVQGARAAVRASFGSNNLLVTNCVSSGGLLLIGDLLQQSREPGANKTIDRERSLRMLLIGLSQGPPHHYWYLHLDRLLPGKSPVTVCKKILADQLVAAPFFALTFVVGAALLEGQTLAHSWAEFKAKFPTIYLFDWVIWPPSQAINFLFIPAPFRVLYVNCVTVLWDVFLSYMKHRPDTASKEQKTLSSDCPTGIL